MSTCKTCKWWNETDSRTETGPASVDYESVAILHKPCVCPKIVDTSNENHHYAQPMDAACVSDFEGYKAELRTGPDFGCIHHEEKEATP